MPCPSSLRPSPNPLPEGEGEDTKKAAFRAALARRFRCRPLHDDDPFVFVKFGQHNLYDLTLLGRHQLADVIRLNRQLAMFIAAINQHGQLHPSWSSEIDQLVDRGPHRATGVKYVVNQDD